jgi:hypothetical protein
MRTRIREMSKSTLLNKKARIEWEDILADGIHTEHTNRSV